MSQAHGHHGTKAEKARRVHRVYKLLVAGMDRESIIMAGNQLGWNVSTRTIDVYIAEATQRLQRAGETDRAKDFGTAKARFDALYGRAWDDKDTPTALRVLDKECELLGLYPPRRSDVSVAMTDDMLVAEHARLKAELAKRDPES
jgi:hypothetical protein